MRQHSPTQGVLVLAHVRDAAADIARLACDSALVGIHRLAWRDFVIAAGSGRLNTLGLSPVHKVAREALATRALASAAAAGKLRYLDPVAGFPGTPRSLAVTLEDLRLNRISAADLASCGSSGPDLSILSALMAEELESMRGADHAMRVELALQSVRDGSCELAGLPLLLVDVQADTVSERELIQSLLERAPAALELRLGVSPIAVTCGLSSMQRYLFTGEAVPERPLDSSFALFSASGEALEGVEIARRIVAAAASGVRFDEMAVLLRSPERYQPLVAEALRRAGVEAHYSRGVRRPAPAGRAFLALLHCAADGLTASRFAEYLSLGQVPREEDEPRTPARWERFLVDAAVVGGRDRWQRRLKGLLEDAYRSYEREEDETVREGIARRISGIESLTGFALPIVDRLAALPSSALWGDWLDSLAQLAALTLRNPEDVLELLDELAPMADTGPVDLGAVLRVLEEPLTVLRRKPSDQRYGKVWVGSMGDSRGLVFRRVFVPGLNESLFPRPPREDPLLLDAQRDRLLLARQKEDSDLLRIAAACASEQIVLSYSRLDLITGRQRVPSFFAFESFKAARGSTVEIPLFRQQTQIDTQTRLGWPAPMDPQDAIDDAEFDLATLRPAMDSGGEGEGAYLTRVNPIVARSLRTRYRRWERKAWTSADGLVVADDSDVHQLVVLEKHRLEARAYSVSSLQQFARCPYRFALRAILRLEAPDEHAGLERLDPATRGRLFHQMQSELFRRFGRQITAETLEAALELLDTILFETRAQAEQDLAPAIPQVWAAEWEAMRADLRGWVQHLSDAEQEWKPELSEFAFGLPQAAGRDPRSQPEHVTLLERFRLRGAIDQVDRHVTGSLRVVDHKTGKPPSPPPSLTGSGEILQPVLYALAAEQALGERVVCGRLFYATLRGNYTRVDVPISTPARDAAQTLLETLDDWIRRGFLPAAPRRDGCKGCEFVRVCGPYEEERIRLKPKANLEQLADLRKMR